MMTDPIADMLTRIRNAAIANLDRTEMPFSNIKRNIAAILKEEGYIADFAVDTELPAKLTVFMKYGRDRAAAIAGVRRMSRPGRRMYAGHDAIPKVRNGLGVAIMSTSKGVMTDRRARTEKIGGEILCEVW
jgi:small subunit ribosomal protein S8